MPFLPGDIVAAFGVYLRFQRLEQALCKRHPGLAERVHFDDSQGRMLLNVALSGAQSIGLAHVRMGYTVVWAVLDPDLNSEPSLWPLDTPDDVLLDVVHAYASAHLADEPVSSPWRWHESEPSAMTELADLLDARGMQVRRVAAGNRYFTYGPRLSPKLDIVGERDESILETEFPETYVRVSLKPSLGWLMDVHAPRWGGWGRLQADRCLRRKSSPSPGLHRADVSVQEIADLLCEGPDAWEMEPSWEQPRHAKPSTNESGTALLERLFAPRLTRGTQPECGEQSSERWNRPDKERAPERRQVSIAPRKISGPPTALRHGFLGPPGG